ncbi:MAG: hypothetical protein ACOY46_02770 [Bacillota bacterium]
MKKIEGPFGIITIHPPDKVPTQADENRLYNVLVDCLITKGINQDKKKRECIIPKQKKLQAMV